MSQGLFKSWPVAALSALLLTACATPPPPALAEPCPTPEMTARKQARADAWRQYVYARDHTANGSRAYGYFTYDELRHPVIQLMLIVQPDGGGTLYGSFPQPAELTAAEIAPVEAAVLQAGFPDLPTAAPDPGAICFADEIIRDTFDAARDGRQVSVRGNICGSLAAKVYDASQALVALTKTHGGLVNAYQVDLWGECPVPIKVRARL